MSIGEPTPNGASDGGDQFWIAPVTPTSLGILPCRKIGSEIGVTLFDGAITRVVCENHDGSGGCAVASEGCYVMRTGRAPESDETDE